MALSSLRLIVECEHKGLLSKEAAVSLLKTRDKIIKDAMAKEASNIFKMRRAASKVQKPMSLIERILKGSATGTRENAGWSDVAGNLMKMMVLAGATAGIASGTGALIRHSKDRKLQKAVQQSYKQVIELDPELARTENRTKTRQMFGVLAKLAPSLAAVPAVAAPIVRSLNTAPAELHMLKALTDIQSRIDEAARHRRPVTVSPLRAGEFAAKAMLQ